MGQVGGWPKLVAVVHEFAQYFWGRAYFLAAGLALYLVFRRWPQLGRALLVLLPLPLYVAGNYYFLQEGGFAIVLVFLAPFLYLFVPHEHRRSATLLLLWVGSAVSGRRRDGGMDQRRRVPACRRGAGPRLHGQRGVSRLGHQQWLERLLSRRSRSTDGRRGHPAVPATVVLVALVAITIVYQFQFIVRFQPYADLTSWVSSGPFWGVHTNPQRKAYLEQFAADLRRYTTPRDRLLVDSEFPAAYLFWPYRIASNSVWIASPLPTSPLPQGHHRLDARASHGARPCRADGPPGQPVQREVREALRPWTLGTWSL